MNTGTLALDIDGTITDAGHHVPEGVASFFSALQKEGWQFVFLTGRPFSFAVEALKVLPFPYLLAVQNGADLLTFPHQKRIGGAYLPLAVVEEIDLLYKREGRGGDFVIYAGYDQGDLCYFRPHCFNEERLSYLKDLEALTASPLVPVNTFEMEQRSFPLIKCFGERESMEQLRAQIAPLPSIKTTLIKDPFSPHFYYLLITHSDADKGVALNHFISQFHLPSPIIAAGNDNNDLSLLRAGEVRIAMSDAPEELRALAHIVAPPSTELGIIEGLKEAIE